MPKGKDENPVALSETQEARALHYALRELPNPGHNGWAHPTSHEPNAEPFRFRPNVCPGCCWSVLQQMFRDRSGR